MSELETPHSENTSKEAVDMRTVIKSVIHEFLREEESRKEPAYKAELLAEREKREQLERRLNELIAENQRTKERAEITERHAAIRSELQSLGVSKVELAFKTVKDDIARSETGELVAVVDNRTVPLREYLQRFVSENPEFLPARIPGGSGVAAQSRPTVGLSTTADLEQLRPGMSEDDLQRVREEIARLASQHLRGM